MLQLLTVLRSQIKYKIILPYLLLMLLVMLVGAGVAVYFVASSWQERFNNQLGQVGRNFANAFARQEQSNLDFLAWIAFATSSPEENRLAVADAMASGDPQALAHALEPFFAAGIRRDNSYNVVLDRLIAFDRRGQSMVHWERPNNATTGERIDHGATDLSQLELVQKVLTNREDDIGDKYAALMTFKDVHAPPGTFSDSTHYFFTVVPVQKEVPTASGAIETTLVGGLLIASQLENLLAVLERQSQSEITAIYNATGEVLNSTVIPNDGLQHLDMPAYVPERLIQQMQTAEAYIRCFDVSQHPLRSVVAPSGQRACSFLETMAVNGHDFQFLYAPLVVRNLQVGYFSVGLSRDYVTAPWADSRNTVIMITLLLALGAVVVGYQVAQQITQPLHDLVQTAEAVTSGQLDRRSTVAEHNEFGKLAQAFNHMTEHLLRLYITSRDLNHSLDMHQVLDVAARSASGVVPGIEALALLKEPDGWVYYVRSEPTCSLQHLQHMPLHGSASLVQVLEQQQSMHLLSIGHTQDDQALLMAELQHTANFTTALLAPLLLHNDLVGILVFGHSQSDPLSEANIQALTAIANMSVTVLQNATLYLRVQKDATERQAILTSIGDGVIVCDSRGKIVLANPMAESLLHLHDWRTTRPYFDELPLEPVSATRELFGHATDRLHYRIGDRVVSRSDAPVVTEDGHILGEVIVLHDITVEAAVDKAKTDFIATISHELRTPLTIIRGYVDLLLRGAGGELSADQAELLESVRARAIDMTSLVNNVIMIAHIESGTLSTELQPQDALMILELALAPLRSKFETKGLKVFIENTIVDRCFVLADREQLKTIFTQLLDNALRYTERGSVTVRMSSHDTMVQIDIEDTGSGIPLDMQRRLFTRFQRIEGNNSAQRGSGLGLAITRQLAERQQGKVWVTSTPGKGSTFTLLLPKAYENTLELVEQTAAETTS